MQEECLECVMRATAPLWTSCITHHFIPSEQRLPLKIPFSLCGFIAINVVSGILSIITYIMVLWKNQKAYRMNAHNKDQSNNGRTE